MIRVKVTKKKITAYATGKSFVTAKRPEGLRGQVGFTDLKGWTKATIKGKSDMTEEPWLYLKKSLEAHEAVIRRDFKPADHLPEWMFEK